MNRGKSSGRGGMKGRKRRRIYCSDDSDEDFVVDEYEDNDHMDHADDVDDGDDGLSSSDESDAKARRKNPRRILSSLGVRRRKRRGRLSGEKVDEDDEEFDPGMEYITEDEESVLVRKALVKKQARNKRTRSVASSTSRKTVLNSRVTNKRKRHVKRRIMKPEDGFLAGGQSLGRKRTRLKNKRVKKQTRRTRKPEPPLDSDSDFIVSDAEIDVLTDLSVGGTLKTRSRGSRWLMRHQAACQSQHQLQKGRRSKRAAKVDGTDDNGKAKTLNLCKQVCGICLSEERRETVRGRLNCCDHFFCFACIMEWSKVESRCPMCKQRFVSVNKSSKWGIGDVSIRVPRRNQVYQPSEEELRSYLDPYGNIVCMVCHEGDDDNLMLLCDICDSSAHTYCVGLGREVPEGNWYCECCKTFDLGASNLQRGQDPMADQLADCSWFSDGSVGSGGLDIPMPSYSVSECLITSPVHYPCRRGDSSPQSPFCEDLGITSQVSGFVASTVMSRRRLRHQIHRLITNNRMGQTLDLADMGNMPINATFGSDASKFEVEEDDEEKECFGGLKHDGLCDHVDNGGGRCGTFGLADSFGESSSRQLQNREFFSSKSLSLDGSDTWCLVNCTAVNADGSNVFHNQVEVVHSEVVYSDRTQDRCEFKDIARRSTHTIVAAYGYKCSSSMAIMVQPPSCCHTPDSFGLGNLARHCCSNCFSNFVGGVVRKIMKSVLNS
ncbi:PHD and RING finger domain-containing protein 1 [Nymphaea thermarum]|nr:PHD and RING finger domain-containing protein 1 [Nymphaea thermarum]